MYLEKDMSTHNWRERWVHIPGEKDGYTYLEIEVGHTPRERDAYICLGIEVGTHTLIEVGTHTWREMGTHTWRDGY